MTKTKQDTTDQGKTAAELRADAQEARERAAESFERCDTDGFVSQWADGLTAALQDTRADITEAGGLAEFAGLYEGDRRVRARVIGTKYGYCWLLDAAEAERFGRKFVPTGKRSRIQKEKGLREARELAPAWAALDGRGTGLSGSVWVSTFRTGCKWGSDAKEITTDA